MTAKTGLQNRIADALETLRSYDRKKLTVRLVAVAALIACLAYLAAGSCASDQYGVFASDSVEASASDSVSGLAESSRITADTGFDELEDGSLTDATTRGMVVVFVSGAVEKPGLYELQADKRIGDAIALAGGIRADGAPDAVNLAAPLEDGQQIRIPTVEEAAQQAAGTSGAGSDGATAAGTAAASGEGTATSQGGISADGKVNINSADLTTLQTLSGIGPATAQKIIDYRTAHGPFASIEGLKEVSGIGEKKYAAIADSICV